MKSDELIPKEFSPFQEFLIQRFMEFERKAGRPVSENTFARYLGVSSGNWNAWKWGTRVPEYASAILLAEKLGPEVFEILGYPPVVVTKDKRLLYIISHWNDDGFEEMQDLIYDNVKEEVAKVQKELHKPANTVEHQNT